MCPSSVDEPLIPRIIHRLWLGDRAAPRIFDHYEKSWRRHHPEWEMRLWRDETLPALACQAEFNDEGLGKKRFDIARLEILRQWGGVFIDMDCEAIRPLDPLLRGVSAFFGRVGRNHVGNQVMGAVPHHPFFELAVSRLAASVRAGGTTNKVAGKAFLERVLLECPEGVTIFPCETFYFEPSFEPPKRPNEFPGVYAVHHELATYSMVPAETAIDRRFMKFERSLTKLMKNLERGGVTPAGIEHVQGRLEEAERRLRRGFTKLEQAFRADLHRAEAVREQAEARLREARLTAERRTQDVKARVTAIEERLSRLLMP